ncbi:hypothetical protein L209DRAFT_55929 [Thermothelomyces heterothallicus CBS 203.75]
MLTIMAYYLLYGPSPFPFDDRGIITASWTLFQALDRLTNRLGIGNQLAHLSPDGSKVRVLRLQSHLRD